MQTAVDAWPTREVQLILQIVDGAYAAACGEAAWEQVLAKICRLGGLDGAALSTLGATEPRRVALAAVGLAARHEPRAWHGAMAGDAAGYEEAMRALFAADAARFDAHSASWAEDVRAHVRKLAEPAFAAGDS